MQYHLVKEKQRYMLVLMRWGSNLQYILQKSIVFYKKIYKSLSIKVFKISCVCWILRIFILIKFFKNILLFKTLYHPRLLTNLSISFFPSAWYVASPARVELDQHIDKFYFVKVTIEHFICSYWKPAWFEKQYQLSIAIGMVDSQVASAKRLDVFCCCYCSLISKNGLSVQCSWDLCLKKFWSALIRLLESVLLVII